jgi:hypothetical protein
MTSEGQTELDGRHAARGTINATLARMRFRAASR